MTLQWGILNIFIPCGGMANFSLQMGVGYHQNNCCLDIFQHAPCPTIIVDRSLNHDMKILKFVYYLGVTIQQFLFVLQMVARYIYIRDRPLHFCQG